MKTPEEWIEDFNKSTLCDGPSEWFLKRFIESVQSEAYLEGQLKGLEDGKKATMKVIDEVFGKPTV